MKSTLSKLKDEKKEGILGGGKTKKTHIHTHAN